MDCSGAKSKVSNNPDQSLPEHIVEAHKLFGKTKSNIADDDPTINRPQESWLPLYNGLLLVIGLTSITLYEVVGGRAVTTREDFIEPLAIIFGVPIHAFYDKCLLYGWADLWLMSLYRQAESGAVYRRSHLLRMPDSTAARMGYSCISLFKSTAILQSF